MLLSFSFVCLFLFSSSSVHSSERCDVHVVLSVHFHGNPFVSLLLLLTGALIPCSFQLVPKRTFFLTPSLLSIYNSICFLSVRHHMLQCIVYRGRESGAGMKAGEALQYVKHVLCLWVIFHPCFELCDSCLKER